MYCRIILCGCKANPLLLAIFYRNMGTIIVNTHNKMEWLRQWSVENQASVQIIGESADL